MKRNDKMIIRNLFRLLLLVVLIAPVGCNSVPEKKRDKNLKDGLTPEK